jgi:hypothetical protein
MKRIRTRDYFLSTDNGICWCATCYDIGKERMQQIVSSSRTFSSHFSLEFPNFQVTEIIAKALCGVCVCDKNRTSVFRQQKEETILRLQ